jgi:hypothetical protein
MRENKITVAQIDNSILLDRAHSFSKKGTLKSIDGEYVYLNIEDRYINELFPLLKDKKATLPKYFSMGIGAHISVIYPEEKSYPIFTPGQVIEFQIQDLFKAQTKQAIYYVLMVTAPELINIRHQNNLSNQLNFNGLMIDTHITIGKYDFF